MNWSEGYNIHAVIAVAIGLWLFLTGGPFAGWGQGRVVQGRPTTDRAGFAAHLARRQAANARRRESRALWRFSGAGLLALGAVYLIINLREVAG